MTLKCAYIQEHRIMKGKETECERHCKHPKNNKYKMCKSWKDCKHLEKSRMCPLANTLFEFNKDRLDKHIDKARWCGMVRMCNNLKEDFECNEDALRKWAGIYEQEFEEGK